MDSRNGNIELLALPVCSVYHFMGTSGGKDHHKIGVAKLMLKISGKLCEHLCLTAVCLADLFIAGDHAVVSAYNNYAHRCVLPSVSYS